MTRASWNANGGRAAWRARGRNIDVLVPDELRGGGRAGRILPLVPGGDHRLVSLAPG
jgi:hypothetical protein